MPGIPTVIIKSRLQWETLFVQPLTLLHETGMLGGTKGQSKYIAQFYDVVVKTGMCNMPIPSGPTPPAPCMTGKMPMLEMGLFVGYKIADIINFIKALPALLMAALKKLIKKYSDKLKAFYEKWKKKHEPLIKKIKKIITLIKGLIKVTLLLMQGKIREAVDAGATAKLPGFKWLKKKVDKIPTIKELIKEIKKIIQKIKTWVNKKLEPIKKKIDNIKKWIVRKINNIKDRILIAIAKRIAVHALKKVGYSADLAKAATGTYIDSVEAAKAAIMAKILAIKSTITKILTIVKNIAKIAIWIAIAVQTTKAIIEIAKSLPKLKDLLKPPKLRVPNIVGFGVMNMGIPVAKMILQGMMTKQKEDLKEKVLKNAMPDTSIDLGMPTAEEGPDLGGKWDIRSKNFELPAIPTIANVAKLIKELFEKGIDKLKEEIEKNPKLKRRIKKIKDWVDKKIAWVKKKIKWIEDKVKAAMKFIKDLKKNIIKKATEVAIKLLIKMLPPRGADPTVKIRLLKAKIDRVKKLIKKIKEIVATVKDAIALVLKIIKDVLKKIAAAIQIIALLTAYYATPLNIGLLYAAAEIANKEFDAKIDTDKTPKEIIRQLVKKILGKHYPKLQKWLKKWELRLQKVKDWIKKKLKFIKDRIALVMAFVKAAMGLLAALVKTNTGQIIASALSVGLLSYWAGAQLANGGVVTFPGLPLQAIKTLDGKNAVDVIAMDIFNSKSELDAADKYRSLANVFDAHMKTVFGIWPKPPDMIPIPWFSYG